MRRMWGAMLILVMLLGALPAMAETRSGSAPGPAANPIAIDETGVHVIMELDGVRITGLTQAGSTEATAMGGGGCTAGVALCTADLYLALDELDRTAGFLTERSRHDTTKNAIGNIRGIVADLGSATGDLDGDGYPDMARRPGRPTFSNITLRRAGMQDTTLYEWFKKAMSGEDARKSGSIIYLDREGSEVARYNLFECWPVAWRVGTEAGIVEEIEFAVERVERAKAMSDISVNEEGLPAARFPVQLEADGVLVGRFESLSTLTASLAWGEDDDCDGIAATACPSDRPSRCADGSCVAGLKASLDLLEQEVRESALANQADALKLISQIRAQLPELDAALEGAYRPGRPVFGNITLERELSAADGAAQWITETVQGKPWKRKATLLLLDKNGKPLLRLDLGESGPVRYAVEARNGRLVEVLEVRVDRIEMK